MYWVILFLLIAIFFDIERVSYLKTVLSIALFKENPIKGFLTGNSIAKNN